MSHSTEYTRSRPDMWCTNEALSVLDRCGTTPHDSYHLLEVLLLTPGGVVCAAFESLGFDCADLARQARSQKRPSVPQAISWLALARERAAEEKFPLATDHFLEVLWDQGAPAGDFLATMLDEELLESALNAVRYNDDDDEPGAVGKRAPISPKPLHGSKIS